MPSSPPDLRCLLLKKGLRLTRQRQEILDYLNAGDPHASAEVIYEKLRKHFPLLGRATVFRTLKLFEDVGLCARMPAVKNKSRFELKTGKTHHDHMICVKCGTVIEFSNKAIENLQEREARLHGFSPLGHTLEITGYCRKCKPRRFGDGAGR